MTASPAPFRAPRTCLTVPGSSTAMLRKAASLAADQVILDLEDSVAPDEKEQARANVVAALADDRWGDRMLSVRVNAVGSETGLRDLEAVGRSDRLETVVLPKVESPEDLESAERALGDGVGLEPLIETARGLAGVEAIAAATGRVAALVFGPLDMSASLGLSSLRGDGAEGYPGDPWHYARFRILVAARAVGARAVDGPFPVIDDADGLRRSAATARAIGYDGKWVIHPSQIDVVNEAFTPTLAELERAKAVLRAYDDAVREGGRGAVRLGALMVDEATRKVASAVVARARVAGVDG